MPCGGFIKEKVEYENFFESYGRYGFAAYFNN